MVTRRTIFLGIIALSLIQFGWGFALDGRIEELETEINELEEENSELKSQLEANQSLATSPGDRQPAIEPSDSSERPSDLPGGNASVQIPPESVHVPSVLSKSVS
jgi:TolA-binding protein